MAQQVKIVLFDDIEGGEADETVQFALDGTAYEIDLTTKNASALRDTFATYVAAARKAGRGAAAPRRRSTSAGSGDSRQRAGEIRAWAKERGLNVSERGRVSADIVAKYDAAH